MAKKITSVSWVERDHKGETTQWWVRLDPPAIASRRSDGLQTIYDHRGTLRFSNFRPRVLRTLTSIFHRSKLDYLLAPPTTFDSEGNPHASASSFGAVWSISFVDDEQHTLRFRRAYPYHECEVEEIILADRESRRMIRKEIHERKREDQSLVRSVIREQYRYNEVAPDGTFDPPSGLPIEISDWRSPNDTISCTEEELAVIKCAIAANDRGWRNANFDQVASVWRFWHFPHSQYDETKCLPTTLEWKTLVEAQRGVWHTWESTVESVSRDTSVSLFLEASSPARWNGMSIPLPSMVYRVGVMVTCERNDGNRWIGPNILTLIKEEDGFHIIHWETFAEEIEYRLGQA